jgi:nitroimidazol reductase NimA-like FMN-containing flavoprotein (pyridoxamine 5'-phosphate oxidase superfamily)
VTHEIQFPERELIDLEPDECLHLLELESIGRLATVGGPTSAPDVVPVNYVLDGDRPVLRSHDGELLEHALAHRVSLQVDRFDWFHRSGWSVMVQGQAEIIHPSPDVEGRLDSWAPGPQPRFLRITPEHITGRRIELHQRPLDAEGYL